MKKLKYILFIFICIFFTTNSFSQFVLVLPHPHFDAILSLSSNDTCVFAGSGGAGMYRTRNSGNSWDTINNNIAPWYYFSLLSPPDTLWAGSFGHVNFSIDNGTTWQDVNINYNFNDDVLSLNRKGNYLYAGAKYRSISKNLIGTTIWTPCNTGIHDSAAVNDILVVGSGMYIGTDSGVYKSTNNGASWWRLNSLPNILSVNKLFFENGIFYAGTSDGIYKSVNWGTTWTFSSSGLPLGSFVTSFALLNDSVFAGTYTDLFVSSNHGGTWTPFSGGIPPSIGVSSLTTFKNKLFAGNGAGVYRYTGGPLGISSHDATNDLRFSIYPNPSANKFFVQTNNINEECSLYVYSCLGIKIMEQKIKANAEIELSEFPSGIYFIEIQNGENVITKKIVKE